MTALMRWCRTRWAPLTTAALVYVAAFAFTVTADPEPTGDEPHYLVYATSIGHGWGVDLRRAYRPINRRSFHPGPLDEHVVEIPGTTRMVTWHGAGLPALLAPFSSRDRTLLEFRGLMILIAAFLAYHLQRLIVTAAGVPSGIAMLSTLAVMLSPPLIFYSSQFYPETAAGSLVVLAFRALVSSRPVSRRLAGATSAAALLPWFNLRYVTLTLLLGGVIAGAAWIAAAGEGRRRLLTVASLLRGAVVAGLLIGGTLVLFHFELYGGLFPPAEDASGYYTLSNLYAFGAGAIIDRTSGLLPMAPVFVIALVAIPTAARRFGNMATLGAAAVAVGYCAFNGYFGSPGFSPPGRYVVSVVPLLALPLAVVLSRGGILLRCVTGAALAAGLVTTVESAQHFPDVYTANRQDFRVIRAMADIWPITSDRSFGDLNRVAEQIPHAVGSLEMVNGAPFLVAREARDAAGALAFGPYTSLRNGRYRATVELLIGAVIEQHPAASTPDAPGVTVEITREGEQLAHAVYPLPSQGTVTTTKTLEFTITMPGRIELRVWYDGRGTLGVRRTSSALVAPLPMADTRLDRWKSAVWGILLTGVAWLWRWKARVDE